MWYFKSSSGKTVSFLRVVNITDVIKKSVHQLNASGLVVKKSNVPDNVLWILLSGDKGGISPPNYSCNFLTAMNNTLSVQLAYWQFLKGTKTVMSAWRKFLVQLLQR